MNDTNNMMSFYFGCMNNRQDSPKTSRQVLLHWEKPFKHATAPKTGARISRTLFEEQFKNSFKDAQDGAAGYQSILGDIDLDMLWKDFAAKVRSGHIPIGSDGKTSYHVDENVFGSSLFGGGSGSFGGFFDSNDSSWFGWFSRFLNRNMSDKGMSGLMVLNLVALVMLNKMKNKERAKKKQELQKKAEELGGQKGFMQTDIDEDGGVINSGVGGVGGGEGGGTEFKNKHERKRAEKKHAEFEKMVKAANFLAGVNVDGVNADGDKKEVKGTRNGSKKNASTDGNGGGAGGEERRGGLDID